MAKKYFKLRTVGTILAVNDEVKVGEGKNQTSLIEQYEKRPDYYIPCDAKGNPLKADKAVEKEAEPKVEAKADKKAEKAEKE
jgi:hypothetical protein